ncbi:hypothetical protein GCM10010124_21100 [Pilimelia terevasa]|uniref:Uncharacterized protein n=1 Tax=Pilimelia terevasa TaxID=53372 RepID=A0A8J3BK72_9ACTN|nr:RNA polymerase sigma factor SigF [Pilimelia terevasa]GGK28232.1 hypothetical protein GCM10010124_21100 [Pilimelia terevasa]
MSTSVHTRTTPAHAETEFDSVSRERLALLASLPAQHPSRAKVRDTVIESWMPLARKLALRFTNRGENTDDLIQVATVGLIKAVDRFDPGRGVDFAGFAIPTIVGEIKRHFRDRTWDVRVPRRLQELRLQIAEARGALTQSLGRSPTVTDIAEHLSVGDEDVLEALEAAHAYNAVSLSTPLGGAADSGGELGDTLPEPSDEYAAADLRATLGPALSQLDPREQKIIVMRFYGNMTQSQIAAEIGVSQMHVSRLLARALGTLRGALT